MIVKNLELSNFKTIKTFKQDFSGDVYIVAGENEIGKSTLLKAVAILLTGQREDVLSAGEKKGFAKAVIGADGIEYNVELKFTEKNPKGSLSVTDPNGLKADTVSAFAKIFGYQDFDANQFVLWGNTTDGRRKQVELIKSLLPKKTQEQIEKLDEEIGKLYDQRTTANSTLRVHENILKSKGEYSDEILKQYSEKINTDDLLEQVRENAVLVEQYKGVEERYEDRKDRVEEIPEDIKTISDEHLKELDDIDIQRKNAKAAFDLEMERLEKKEQEKKSAHAENDKKLRDELVSLEEKQKKAEKWMEENKPENIDEIKEKIDKAKDHNMKCENVSEYLKAKTDFDKAKKESEDLTTDIDGKRSKREELIAKSKLPVKGLSFTDDGLFLNGIPFVQGKVSTSQEMEVAARLIIAKNPKTKVFRVARGESLGSEKLKALVNFAKKNGYQGFIEEVVRGQNEMVVSEYSEK